MGKRSLLDLGATGVIQRKEWNEQFVAEEREIECEPWLQSAFGISVPSLMPKARLMPCVAPDQVIEFWRVLPSSGLTLCDESVETVEKVDALNLSTVTFRHQEKCGSSPTDPEEGDAS